MNLCFRALTSSLVVVGGLLSCGGGSTASAPPAPPVFEQDTVTDLEGNVYRTVKIGTQWWMAENLKSLRYRNGDPIQRASDLDAWDDLTSGAFSYYRDDATYGVTYGCLYNWYAVSDARGLAPVGWHVATDADFTLLTAFLGEEVAGGRMKEAGTAHWDFPNTGADNTSGFTALPAGIVNRDPAETHSQWTGMGGYAHFWTATADALGGAYSRHLGYNHRAAYRLGNLKSDGYSVRCVRD